MDNIAHLVRPYKGPRMLAVYSNDAIVRIGELNAMKEAEGWLDVRAIETVRARVNVRDRHGTGRAKDLTCDTDQYSSQVGEREKFPGHGDAVKYDKSQEEGRREDG
jgi:hypothetical protein